MTAQTSTVMQNDIMAPIHHLRAKVEGDAGRQCDSLPSTCDSLPSKYDSLPSKYDNLPSKSTCERKLKETQAGNVTVNPLNMTVNPLNMTVYPLKVTVYPLNPPASESRRRHRPPSRCTGTRTPPRIRAPPTRSCLHEGATVTTPHLALLHTMRVEFSEPPFHKTLECSIQAPETRFSLSPNAPHMEPKWGG